MHELLFIRVENMAKGEIAHFIKGHVGHEFVTFYAP